MVTTRVLRSYGPPYIIQYYSSGLCYCLQEAIVSGPSTCQSQGQLAMLATDTRHTVMLEYSHNRAAVSDLSSHTLLPRTVWGVAISHAGRGVECPIEQTPLAKSTTDQSATLPQHYQPVPIWTRMLGPCNLRIFTRNPTRKSSEASSRRRQILASSHLCSRYLALAQTRAMHHLGRSSEDKTDCNPRHTAPASQPAHWDDYMHIQLSLTAFPTAALVIPRRP